MVKRKLEDTTTEPEEKATKITKSSSETIKIINWNVNGFNALLKKNSGENIKNLVSTQKPVALCIQETKLNKDEKKYTELLPGYTAHFNYCQAKKGYSGTCVYTSDEYKPLKVTFGMGVKEHDNEGRNITVEYEKFYLVCTYVPNAGQKLERLTYRVEEWDPAMLNYLQTLEKVKPVVWTGDLNCAILDIDVHNPKTNKSAGFTPKERASFQKFLDSGFVDTFRKYHPNEKDLYTYWSYKFDAKAKNNGWRLDYFLISSELEKWMNDSGILKDVEGSDHCPIYLDLDFTK